MGLPRMAARITWTIGCFYLLYLFANELLGEGIFMCNNTRSYFNLSIITKYVMRGKCKPSAIFLPPHSTSVCPHYDLNDLYEIDCSCHSAECHPSVPTHHCSEEAPRLGAKTPSVLGMNWAHLSGWSAVLPARLCMLPLSLNPPCLYTLLPNLGRPLLPLLYPTNSSLVLRHSAQISRPVCFPWCASIHLPRKLLSLKVYCPCACLSPLLTRTPWGQRLRVSPPGLCLTPWACQEHRT